MARYKGPRLRIIRRLGKLQGLTLKSSSKLSSPGQHGSSSLGKKDSQFNIRLREKQKLRFYYGISEGQLLNYLKKARKKKGSSGVELLTFLEMRLDNIIFRFGLAKTILAARQLVVHGHILVNNKVVNIPSFACKPLDVLKFKSMEFIDKNKYDLNNSFIPSHLSFNLSKSEFIIDQLVNRNSLLLFVNELLVVEYYSRKL